MATEAKKTVATPSDEVNAMAEVWKRMGALLGGTDAMRAAGKTLLPMWPKEEQGAYEARLAQSVLFPAYKRTVSTLTAKPFSKPITINDDVPARIKEWLKNIDLQGRNLDSFSADVMHASMGYGLAGILVEMPDESAIPKLADGTTTQAMEQTAGVRVYWAEIKCTDLLGWKAELIKGAWKFTMLRFMELKEEADPANEFDKVKVPQVRVLEPGKWRTFRKDAKNEWQEHQNGTTSLTDIPFVPTYGEREGFMCGRPPLQELGHLNIKHWQSQSDQDHLLHVARVPILVATGVQDTPEKPWELTVGSGAAVKLPKDATLEYVEHTGSAIGAGKQSLDDLKDEMRQAGAELLVLGGGANTRIEARSENDVGMCALQWITLGLQDAINQALQYTADFIRLPKGGTVKLFTDFGAATLAEASAQILVGMATAGKLSDETLHGEMQRRGILSAELSWEDEKERIESEGPPEGKIDPLTGLPYTMPVPPTKDDPPDDGGKKKPPTKKPPTKEDE